jgi:hypothetical protein
LFGRFNNQDQSPAVGRKGNKKTTFVSRVFFIFSLLLGDAQIDIATLAKIEP